MSGQKLPRAVLRAASHRTSWGLLVLVGVVALAFGSVHPAAPSRAQRVSYLESVIKCPNCADLSIAQSDSEPATTLRANVQQWVNDGLSDAAIESRVIATYGSNELLAPPVSGVDAAVWIVPLIAFAVAVAGLAVFAWRRKSRAEIVVTAEDEALVAAALSRARRQR